MPTLVRPTSERLSNKRAGCEFEGAFGVGQCDLAFDIGGMGARGVNFHYEVFARMGFEEECARIQDLYLAGSRPEAIAAVPLAMVEKIALVGPKAKITDELPMWENSMIATMMIGGSPDTLRTMAELVG